MALPFAAPLARTLCRQLRANPQQDIPVLMLTARTDDSDRILGLEMRHHDIQHNQVNLMIFEHRPHGFAVRRAAGAISRFFQYFAAGASFGAC
jgi:DNA-binding response OmpR family regulator